ncbi:DUF4255 domain-containing protein [Stigmatella aurantiaca]|uniref:Conserved uncharacterized protein n=1 Tax=Stigmatella aurantiaca (strain DW4/3-1) TaxID=378806 RepID=Q09DG5_STIAD|nr:DUF4255 domain-containing protein [Stigmatella aurantiaca]ADO69347.1 conserved uncharacterized protein [Stigmatella aurantiaca DW4/3-1]EAU69819.1 conserved hypothetical protein [Stigmatella aurantiaca DW4/3-1]
MIGTALSFVCGKLNTYFREAQHDSREVVSLCPPEGHAASSSHELTNRILFSLCNVLQETTLRNQPPSKGSSTASRPPRAPLSINLHVVFSANYTDYVTGLDFLSDVLSFLQAMPVFDHQNSPDLNPRIQKLAFSMVNLDYAQLSNLWSMLRVEYRPSALYEMRMLTLPQPGPSSSPSG